MAISRSLEKTHHMPTATRTVAKGIAPRTHLPPKPKKNNRKRNADEESSADESEQSDSDDARSKAKAKKHKRQRLITVPESEEELESVDDTTELPRKEVEEVEDLNEPGGKVSTNFR